MATVAKPIQAKTLSAAAAATRPSSGRGTASDWPSSTAAATNTRPATEPAAPRAKSGGSSSRSTFMAGQFRPQPSEVTRRQKKPKAAALGR